MFTPQCPVSPRFRHLGLSRFFIQSLKSYFFWSICRNQSDVEVALWAGIGILNSIKDLLELSECTNGWTDRRMDGRGNVTTLAEVMINCTYSNITGSIIGVWGSGIHEGGGIRTHTPRTFTPCLLPPRTFTP